MKRVFFITLTISALIFAGCSRDSIETTDEIVAATDSDDDDPEEAQGESDDISTVSFERTITLTWSGNSVSVEGDEGGTVSVTGGRATADNRERGEIVKYILTGTCSDGDFTLYSNVKQALVFRSLSLQSSCGSAVNNQSHKRTFVVLEGSSTLRDAAVLSSGNYPYESDSEDMKAAFFSEGQLVFSGTGSLSVTAQGKAAITSDDYIRFMGTQSVSATSTNGHAIRGKDGITVDDGTITAGTSADGKKAMTSDGSVIINGGTIKLSVSGGTIVEDGEYTGSAGIKSDGPFSITGGSLTVTNSGTGGKGISGDSTASFSGGTVNVTVTGSNYGSSSGRTTPFAMGGGGGFNPGGPGNGGTGPGGNSSSSKSAKGIKFDGDITISGGTISISANAHEGLESKGKLTVSGGTLYSFSSSDDGINSAGDMSLAGGTVCGWSSGNDGIDANGNLTIEGATVYAICTSGSPEVALDANTEGGKKLYLKSGVTVAVGGIEQGSSITGSAYTATSWTKGGWNTLYSASGSEALTFKAPSSGNSLVLYADGKTPEFKSGVSVSGGTQIFGGNALVGGSVSGGNTVNISKYTSSGR